MTLVLRVTHYRNHTPEKELSFIADEADFSIGRSIDNDFVLPDPDRIISHRHAIIHFKSNAYYLMDDSTNGTTINHAEEPVRRDSEVKLNNGDTITIGEYECQCVIDDSVEKQPAYSNEAVPESLAHDWRQDIPQTPLKEHGAAFSDPSLHQHKPSESGLKNNLDPAGAIPDDYDFLKPTTDNALRNERMLVGEHVPAEQNYFRPPEAIPEDWDLFSSNSKDEEANEPRSYPDTPGQGKETRENQERRELSDKAKPNTNEQAFNAFLSGLDLKTTTIPQESIPDVMTLAGCLLREYTQGIKRVLDTRTHLKGEFRLGVTVVQPVENNPLKFSVNVDDALTKLLTPSSKGYLPPVDAIREAIDDLQAHQMAILAGLRAALNTLIVRFDPQTLEDNFQEHSVLDNLLPSARKAKYWDLFKEAYQHVAADSENDFLHYLGDEFAHAYEEQIARLKSARQQGAGH